MPDTTDKVGPRLRGQLGKKPPNKSGPTVGSGVDLGQSKADAYAKVRDRSSEKSDKLPPAELAALKEKIKPYHNIQGGEACKYLHAHPLELTDKEINFLNKAAHEDALATAKSGYERYAAGKPTPQKNLSI